VAKWFLGLIAIMKHISGVLICGHQVASRPSKDYPYGTIEKQKPYFKELGLDLDAYFNGTLNISIAPLTFKVLKPDFMFEKVAWTDLHPPETFSFLRCNVIFKNTEFAGWVYYPHPETKKNHFQGQSLLEIIAMKISNIQYDDEVKLEIDEGKIKVDG
jgi:hypothetical protein